MPDKPPAMDTRLQWACSECGRVNVPLEDAVLEVDDPAVTILKVTCPSGHEEARRYDPARNATFLRNIVQWGISIASGTVDADADALVMQVGGFDAWLDSPQFDAERASLRLTGGAA